MFTLVINLKGAISSIIKAVKTTPADQNKRNLVMTTQFQNGDKAIGAETSYTNLGKKMTTDFEIVRSQSQHVRTLSTETVDHYMHPRNRHKDLPRGAFSATGNLILHVEDLVRDTLNVGRGVNIKEYYKLLQPGEYV